ncbi:MAG: hypothetical protein MRJ96_03785 [Nitrospirales bacterium]|nr:hypothetical protein [Nitrospira sp.]MDR4500560.1 hypothetical protein [Nitrospirales bacterium]
MMSDSSTFWSMECSPGEPDLFVCMDCLGEVFRAKLPVEGCPGCGAVSMFEAFTLESLQDWATPELLAKAQSLGAQPQSQPSTPPVDSSSSNDAPHSAEST